MGEPAPASPPKVRGPGLCINGCGAPVHQKHRCGRCYSIYHRESGAKGNGRPPHPKLAPHEITPELYWVDLERLETVLAERPVPRWWDHGSCVNLPDVDFYPDTQADAQRVRPICAGCPVLYDCLAEALRDKEQHGVWGGTVRRERARLVNVLKHRRLTRARSA